MPHEVFDFVETDRIGVVRAVDTTNVLLAVDGDDLLSRIGIGNIVAIKGRTEDEFLIALVERATRVLSDSLPSMDDGAVDGELEILPTDSLRAALIGTFRTRHGDARNVFKRGADAFPQIDRPAFMVTGGNLQRFMGILGAELGETERLKLGHYMVDASAEAIANGDKFFQRHAAILGSTGSGKSWTVALILEKAGQLAHSNIVVFDMHGEYEPLTNEDNGIAALFKIAGPGDLAKPSDKSVFLPYWLLNRDEMLSMILDRSDQNAPNQASRFTSHVRELKHETLLSENKNEVAESFTVDSPIPYRIADLLERLIADDTAKGVGAGGRTIKGDWEGKLTRFISRLSAKLEDRRYGFMFQPPDYVQSYDWLADFAEKILGSASGKGIKIVDFSEVPSDILPIVTGTLARLIYDIQFWNGEERTPITLLCDEAHLYLPVRESADSVEKQALASFERIAKEGRKYGCSLIVVSQRPSDVSRTILSQCNNFLVLRLTNDSDQNVIRRLMPDSLAGLTSILPLLDIGEALILGDSVLLPSRVRLDTPKIRPNSATRNFWTEWGTISPNNLALRAAIEALRMQSRVPE